MLVSYTLIFMSMVLFAGLAVDVGLLERSYLQLQGATQAAVMASSIALQRSGSAANITAAGKALASSNGFTDGSNGVVVTIANPPTSGTYSGNSMAVMATITKPVPPTFLGVLGLGKVTMRAQAVFETPSQLSLTSAFNVNAIYMDGHSIPSNGGFDADGYAYSANAMGGVRASNGLGPLLSWRGSVFYLGTPNSLNGVSNTTFSLPHGSYSQMLILASTGYGPALNANFVVTYSDGSTATIPLNMSDWCNPAFYSGETIVASLPYRDAEPPGYSTPVQFYGQVLVYGYSINLDNTKTLSTLKLPTVRNVVLLAMDLKQ